MEKNASKYAFVIVHFGNNIRYFEFEMYFLRQLKQFTKYDIIYMYSVNDTPTYFAKTMEQFADKVIEYDDKEITFDIEFDSFYDNFNTLRVCNILFAYTLTQYKKVCVLESDMIIMRNIDDIFDLKTPSFVLNDIDKNFANNEKQDYDAKETLANCQEISFINGGVLLLKPSLKTFEKYKKLIPKISKNNCKYPNETLICLVHSKFYALPAIYNLSQYKTVFMEDMNLKTEDVAIFHFDGSKYKPLDIIKDGWDAKMQSNVKSKIKHKSKKDPNVLQVPISSFKKNTYELYKDEINKFVEIYNKENPAEIQPTQIQPTQTLQINNKKQSFANKSKSKTFKKSKSKTFTHTQKKVKNDQNN